MMVRVLVVDDSVFMRTLVAEMLESAKGIQVAGTARDKKETLQKVVKLRPDVVTLDLVMPGGDGLETLKEIMSVRPTPTVILSAHSRKDAEVTFQCLEAGAVSFVLKPSGELSLDIENVKRELLEAVETASKIDLRKITKLSERKALQPTGLKLKEKWAERIIVIGSSTGGPQALDIIVPSLAPGMSAPVIVVQHMPHASFTKGLSQRLSRQSVLAVKTAEDGERIREGTVYLAPSGSEMRFKPSDGAGDKQPGGFSISLSGEDAQGISPSIDATMRSAAESYGSGCIGVILSGMGHDGRDGIQAIKQAGGQAIVQDEASLIFGMPKAVIDADLADEVLPVEKIADRLMELSQGVTHGG